MSLGVLLCGEAVSDGIAKAALEQLTTSINGFTERLVQFLQVTPATDALVFGPFCARVLLENSCAAVIGRLDPFRLLYLSEFQSQPEYELSKRAKSAFAWSGDVISDDKGNAPLWSVDYDISKISRALFSRHCDHIYWRPAVEQTLDFVSSQPRDPALADILTLDADHYTDQIRGKSLRLYSALSKGVHWEFFTTTLMFDETTVKSHIQDACLLVGQLGLVSHFIPTAHASLAPQRALEAYIEFRRRLS